MNSTFLVESNESKIEFEYFDIEKIDSESVFLVNISSTFTDYIDVEISKTRKTVLLTLEASIHNIHSPTKKINTNMEFSLPEYADIEGYYFNKSGTNIFLIFHKKQILQ